MAPRPAAWSVPLPPDVSIPIGALSGSDATNELHQTIVELNKTTARQTTVMIRLTVVLVVLTVALLALTVVLVLE